MSATTTTRVEYCVTYDRMVYGGGKTTERGRTKSWRSRYRAEHEADRYRANGFANVRVEEQTVTTMKTPWREVS